MWRARRLAKRTYNYKPANHLPPEELKPKLADLVQETCLAVKIQTTLPSRQENGTSPIKIGQARVSTRNQNLALQLDDLNKAGCETIFQEKVSGASTNRSESERLLTQLLTGDTVHIYKLDRLERSLRHLLTVMGDL